MKCDDCLLVRGRQRLSNPRAQGLSWAIGRWRQEVEGRPLVNIHRRTLDDTWRQVIRWFGGDPEALIGPAHDDLVAMEKTR